MSKRMSFISSNVRSLVPPDYIGEAICLNIKLDWLGMTQTCLGHDRFERLIGVQTANLDLIIRRRHVLDRPA